MVNIIVIIFLAICGFYGFYNGAIKMFFNLLAIILGIFIAGKFYVYGSSFLPQNEWTFLLSFAIIFFVSSFIIALVGKFFSKFVEQILLKPIDRILGAFFVILLGFFLIGTVYQSLYRQNFSFLKKYKINDSKPIVFIHKVNMKIYDFFPTSIKNKLNSKNLDAKHIKNEIKNLEIQ